MNVIAITDDEATACSKIAMLGVCAGQAYARVLETVATRRCPVVTV